MKLTRISCAPNAAAIAELALHPAFLVCTIGSEAVASRSCPNETLPSARTLKDRVQAEGSLSVSRGSQFAEKIGEGPGAGV